MSNPTEDNPNNANDARRRALRRARQMLKELSSLSEHASLTGSLKGGAADAAAAFNELQSWVAGQDIALHGIIAPLPADASFDRVGVASRLLKAVLDDELNDEDERDIGELVRHRIRDVGEALREHLPDFLREERGERREAHAEHASHPPHPPHPPHQPPGTDV